jgi:hypothetical protein
MQLLDASTLLSMTFERWVNIYIIAIKRVEKRYTFVVWLLLNTGCG